MIIGGMLISSVEYPGKISLVLFTGGCTLRCPYCHNPELISGGEEVDLDEIKLKIQDSLNFIDSLVITGGEPLVQFEELKELLNYLKDTEVKNQTGYQWLLPREAGGNNPPGKLRCTGC